MGSHLTDKELARMLSMHPNHIDSLHIHRCPEGYCIHRVKSHCQKHGLPFDRRPIMRGFRDTVTPPDIDHIRWYGSFDEMLFEAGPETGLFVVDAESLEVTRRQRFWHFTQAECPVRILAVGGQDRGFCHIHCDEWSEVSDAALKLLPADLIEPDSAE